MSDIPLLSASALSSQRAGSVRDASAAFEGESIVLHTGDTPQAGHHLFLRMLALLETPESGELTLKGRPTAAWDEAARAEARNGHYGFLFRAPFLLPAFSVVENIAIPCFKLMKVSPEEARVPTQQVLELLELEEVAEGSVEELPMVLQHRVALARALAIRPPIVVIEQVDELLKGAELIDFLERLATVRDEFGTLFLISADTPGLAGFADRVLEFRSGELVDDRIPKRFFS